MENWISVKDRLPTEWQRVLVVDSRGHMTVSEWCKLPDATEGFWHDDLHVDPPTHWCELPAPPAEPEK